MKTAFSKTKGVLTLVPLPKIDEIYAQLKDLLYFLYEKQVLPYGFI